MKSKSMICILFAALMSTACSDFLDIKPLDRVSPEQVFSDISEIKTILATLYNKMPMEDFSYNPNKGFNYHQESGGWVELGYSSSFFTDESTNSGGSHSVEISYGYWDYGAIRQINQFMETVPTVDISENEANRLLSEAHFIRAYTYFALAKRFGGVPIVTHLQQMEEGDALYVPRSTEKATWDFILEECDKAAAHLPEKVENIEGTKRATIWAAYALKSRVALFAASLAKYWNKAPLTGKAVEDKLVGGFTPTDAENYYQKAADAAKQIIDNSGKQLYKPIPQNAEEAAVNYQHIFENPTDPEVLNEVIFAKGYIDGTQTMLQGHNTDIFFNPAQTNPGYTTAYGKFSPALNLVDIYEDYTDDGTGKSAPIRTRIDGKEDIYIANPGEGIDINVPYIKYNNPSVIFAGKDARLFGSCIVPGSIWKGVTIIMQGGLISPDGTQLIYQDNKAIGKDGKTYYTFGGQAMTDYSFRIYNNWEDAKYSITGFSLKKFLQEDKSVTGKLFSSTTDYIDMRLAEVYLNYAEAVAESGQGDIILAKKCLNDIRKRAGHRDEIPLTVENVLKERRVELAFEGHRYWDLIRRRDAHIIFNGAAMRKALVPILDLRETTPQYIFVRANSYYDNIDNGRRFNERSYYLAIPGTTSNNLIQNPQY